MARGNACGNFCPRLFFCRVRSIRGNFLSRARLQLSRREGTLCSPLLVGSTPLKTRRHDDSTRSALPKGMVTQYVSCAALKLIVRILRRTSCTSKILNRPSQAYATRCANKILANRPPDEFRRVSPLSHGRDGGTADVIVMSVVSRIAGRQVSLTSLAAEL